jgi:DNA modification methylase
MRPYHHDESVTLYWGDCLDVLPLLEPVDHVISDPPYFRDVYVRMKGNNTVTIDEAYKGASFGKMAAGAIGHIDEMVAPLAAWMAVNVRRWALVFSDQENCWRWRAALVDAGMRYARTGMWVKPDPMPQMTGDRPGQGYEPCTIVHAKGQMRWNGGGRPGVWTYNTAKGDGRPDHPCPKPLPLMSELVGLFTDEGETILDPFAGSGTTGVAAKLNGRKCILIEREEKYCEIAAKRLEQTQPGRLFENLKAKPQSFLAAMGEPGEGLRGDPVVREG